MWCRYHEAIAQHWPGLDVPPPGGARPCFEDMGFAVVDLETTSADPVTARVVEVGVVLADADGHLEGTYTQLVNPGVSVTPNVHGLSDVDVAAKPNFATVGPMVAQLVAGRVLVAHEVAFDWAVLHRELGAVGLPLETPTLCTRENLPCLDVRARSLVDVCHELGIAHPTPHRALPDAVATLALLQRYLDRARQDGHLMVLPHRGCAPTKAVRPPAGALRRAGR